MILFKNGRADACTAAEQPRFRSRTPQAVLKLCPAALGRGGNKCLPEFEHILLFHAIYHTIPEISSSKAIIFHILFR